MLLAIDTSTRIVGVALYDGVQILYERVWLSQDYHTVELAPAIVQMLAHFSVQATDLNALAVALGPGSYTGLRIGLALVKGMALCSHAPIVGIATFDVMAACQPVIAPQLVVALRIGRNRLATGWYRSVDDEWKFSGENELLEAEVLLDRINEPTLVSGEFTVEERRLMERRRGTVMLASPANSLRRPSFLAELGWKRWREGKVDDPVVLAPIYLRRDIPLQAK